MKTSSIKNSILQMIMLSILCVSLQMSCANEKSDAIASNADDEIQKQWDGFISHWEAENAEGLLDYYHEDAINIPNGMSPHKGHDAIEQFYKSLFDAHLSSTYENDILSLETAGNLAIEHGRFNVHWVRNDSTTWTYSARSLAHWQKDSTNTWKIKTFMFNVPPQN